MKLHLPKALLTAALCAVSATTALAKDYDVGNHSGANNLPSNASNYWTHTEDNLTLSGSDKMGYIVNGSIVSSLGQQHYDKPFLSSWTEKKSGTVTKNVKINGTLTIEDEAQVVLGGQYKLTATLSSHDEYTGIIADKVVVNGSGDVTNLNTWNATVNTLEVNSGKVEIHTKVQSGNNYFIYDPVADSKQVRIKHALNINGGQTLININTLDKQNGADDTHIFASFGEIVFENAKYSGGVITSADSAAVVKSLITQTDGILTVQGKTASVGGLNINQSGGTMNISTDGTRYHSWHILSDYGDSEITQSGDATLTIGGIKAYNSSYNKVLSLLTEKGVSYDPAKGELASDGKTVEINPSIKIDQQGSGTISIIKGIDFTNQMKGTASTELSSISQSGSGTIDLKGEYKGVTFDVTQTGTGTINVEGALSTNDVKVSGGYLNLKADVTANSLTQSGTGKVTVIEGKTLTVGSLEITGGVFENHGTISGSSAQAMFAASDIATAADSTATLITVSGGEFVNFGTTENSILVDGGTLTLEKGMLADVTMTDGNIVVKSNSTIGDLTLNGGNIVLNSNLTTGNLTLNGGTITFEEGVKLTLTEGSELNLSNTVIEVKVSEDTLAGLLDGTNKTVTLFETEGVTDELQNVTVTFTDGTNSAQAKVNGTTDGTGVEITTTTVPEPTTATLSLLALAALAARRRRR